MSVKKKIVWKKWDMDYTDDRMRSERRLGKVRDDMNNKRRYIKDFNIFRKNSLRIRGV